MPPYPLFSLFLSLGQNRQDGKGALLASAPYTCPWWDIFHLGQKHTIWDCIRGIFRGGICPPTPSLPFIFTWGRIDKRGKGIGLRLPPIHAPYEIFFIRSRNILLRNSSGAYAPYPLLTFFSPWSRTDKRGRGLCWRLPPIHAPDEIFFIRGINILFRISSVAYLEGAYAPHPLFTFYLYLGQNRQEVEGVMLASAPYTCPWWDIFHQGQKHTS